MIGQTISHYHIIKKLGEGGMGVVYIAEDTHLKRHVAMKFLASLERSYRARFLREAQAVSRLAHPNVAAVYDYGETADGQPYIVMELVEGNTLNDLLLEGSLPVLEAVRVAGFIGEALEEAHRMGIVHRDIKPSNVVITPRNHVKVLDFGLAKLLDEQVTADDPANASQLLATRTHSSVVVGTPLYLSPEQATGKTVDGRSDLFALGAVLYECLTGQSAFSGGSALEIGAQVIHVTPPPPSSINPRVTSELDRITMKALEKDVDQRYQSAAEMVTDLNQVEATLSSDGYRSPRRSSHAAAPSHVASPSAITTLADAIRRPRLSVITLLIAIVASAVVVWAAFKFWKPPPYKPSPMGQDWYTKGTDALRNGAYLQASLALERATKADPGFALAHARLAEAYTELEYPDLAKDQLLLVLNLVPDRSQLPRVDALYLEAINNVVVRDYPAAIKSYSQIASLQPNEARAYVDLGRVYEKNQEIDHAIENYIKASNLDSQYPTAYLRVGSCYSRKGDVASAASALDKAEGLFRAQGNAEGRTEVLVQRGHLFARAGKFDDAKEQFEQALAAAQATNNDSQAINTLFELSYVSFTRGRLEDAQTYAQKAVDYARQKHFENLVTAGINELGNMYRGRGEFSRAETYYKQAVELAKATKQKRLEALGELNLGGLYIHQLRTDEGLALVEQAYQYFQQGSYHHEVLISLTEIARGHRRKGEYEVALRFLQQKLDLAKHTGNHSEEAVTYGEIGSVLIEEERYTEALANYDLSYSLNSSLHNSLLMAYNQHNRGNILWRLGQVENSRKALQEAYEISTRPENGYKALLPDIELSHATILLTERKFAEAAKRAANALTLAGNDYPNVAVEAKSTLCLAKVFSGAKRDGLTLCDEAAKASTTLGDQALISRALLAQAEAALEVGDANNALRFATQAGERFSQYRQNESLWRAWLIAGRASEKLNDAAGAGAYRTRAKEVITQLQQTLGQEAFEKYLGRSDIKVYYKQLG